MPSPPEKSRNFWQNELDDLKKNKMNLLILASESSDFGIGRSIVRDIIKED